MLIESPPIIPGHARSVCRGSATAPPKPSAQTLFVLSAMDERLRKEDERWEQVGENFDTLFAQVESISKNQQRMEVQFGASSSIMEQMLKDQQALAKQLEANTQAMAHLSLNQQKSKDEEPPSPTRSVENLENPFATHNGENTRARQFGRAGGGQKLGTEHFGSDRFTVPKLQFPSFDGTNPRVWKSKCMDFFQPYNVPDALKSTLASLSMEENPAKWLQVYKQKHGLGDWEEFIAAVEQKFGANDYRDAIGELLELTQSLRQLQWKSIPNPLRTYSLRSVCIMMDLGNCFFVSVH